MTASLSSSEVEALVVLALFVLVIARRTVGMIRGQTFSAPRLFVFAGFYVFLFAALAFTTLYAAVSDWGTNGYLLLAPYAAVPVVGGLVAAPYVRRVVRFDRRADGRLYYRLSWQIPVLYLALFVTRIVAELIVLGPASFVFTVPPPSPPAGFGLDVLIGVDLLFGSSLGLLVGRGVGVYLAHRDLPSEGPWNTSPPNPPLPSG